MVEGEEDGGVKKDPSSLAAQSGRQARGKHIVAEKNAGSASWVEFRQTVARRPFFSAAPIERRAAFRSVLAVPVMGLPPDAIVIAMDPGTAQSTHDPLDAFCTIPKSIFVHSSCLLTGARLGFPL